MPFSKYFIKSNFLTWIKTYQCERTQPVVLFAKSSFGLSSKPFPSFQSLPREQRILHYKRTLRQYPEKAGFRCQYLNVFRLLSLEVASKLHDKSLRTLVARHKKTYKIKAKKNIVLPRIRCCFYNFEICTNSRST